MKNIFSTTATTLIELIVALALLSVVVLGLFSISSVLNSNNQDYGQRFLLKSETQATLNHILNNASLAVGTGAVDNLGNLLDQGILIGAAVGDPNSFCIHQDPNNTPDNVNDDIWLCYTWSNNQINYCTMPYVPGANPRGAAACTANNSTFLGTSYNNPAASAIFAMNGAAAGYQMVFSITIQNCLNDSAASCVPDCNYFSVGGCVNGGTTDSANNPEVVKTGSVYPLQQSMSNP